MVHLGGGVKKRVPTCDIYPIYIVNIQKIVLLKNETVSPSSRQNNFCKNHSKVQTLQNFLIMKKNFAKISKFIRKRYKRRKRTVMSVCSPVIVRS